MRRSGAGSSSHLWHDREHGQAGVTCLGYWTEGDPETLPGFRKRFPHLPRFDSLHAALDCGADLALISAIPSDRAHLTIKAMQQGMDVMSDKPGCTTLAQLEQIKACVAQTGRIWSVNFSERFETPASTLASQLVAEGAIGQVVQTVGLGPHRLNRATRPDWFFRKACFGGILTDIASHQIDQFLHYTGSDTAEVSHAFTANYGIPAILSCKILARSICAVIGARAIFVWIGSRRMPCPIGATGG